MALTRCGQSQAWDAVAGMWTSLGMGADGGTWVLLSSFSRLQEMRPIRKTRNQFQVKRRSREPSEPWHESNLFVTLLFLLDTQARDWYQLRMLSFRYNDAPCPQRVRQHEQHALCLQC